METISSIIMGVSLILILIIKLVSNDPDKRKILMAIVFIIGMIGFIGYFIAWIQIHWLYSSIGLCLILMYFGNTAFQATKGNRINYYAVFPTIGLIIFLTVGSQQIISAVGNNIINNAKEETSSFVEDKISVIIEKIYPFEEIYSNGFTVYIDRALFDDLNKKDKKIAMIRFRDIARYCSNDEGDRQYKNLYIGGRIVIEGKKNFLLSSNGGKERLKKGMVFPASGKCFKSVNGIGICGPGKKFGKLCLLINGNYLTITSSYFSITISSNGEITYSDIRWN